MHNIEDMQKDWPQGKKHTQPGVSIIEYTTVHFCHNALT